MIRQFSWNYGGETWTWNLTIPAALYEAYVAVPDSVRSQIPLSGFGYFITTQDPYLQSLAAKINESCYAGRVQFTSGSELCLGFCAKHTLRD